MYLYKSILWSVLSSLIIFTQTIFAAPWSGSGVESDPYQITDTTDLLALGSDPNYYSDYFVLVNDINLSSAGIFTTAIIAPDMNNLTGTVFEGTPFTGSFDGDGYQIINMSITGNKDYIGLFGKIDANGVVKNLGIADCNVIGDRLIGPVAGITYGKISNCRASGDVCGNTHVGGLLGMNHGITQNCYSTCSVTGNAWFGGLVGANGGNISKCWASGNISDTVAYTGVHVGGLVGECSYGSVSNCYATGSVHGRGSVGGLVGFVANSSSLVNCYSTGAVVGEFFDSIGALVGNFLYSSVTGCFWNTETAYWSKGVGNVNPDPNGVIGLDDPNMMIQANFVGWDFVDEDQNGTEDIWQMPFGGGYPELVWHAKPIPFEGLGTPENPYQIGTLEELLAIKDFPEEYDKYYILINDINMSSAGTLTEAVIAPDLDNSNTLFEGTAFAGVFDGQGHTISNLTIAGDINDFVGLFGQIGNYTPTSVSGIVKNLGITNCQINGQRYAGGIAGRLYAGEIYNCYAIGEVTSSYNAGGLIGSASTGNAYISNCYAECNVGHSGTWESGGLMGHSNGYVSNCYATGNVTGYYYVGGLMGQNHRNVSNCYATGTVTGTTDVGGLVGYWGAAGSAENCFWNVDTSGTTDGAANIDPDPIGITGLDDPNMMIQANFVGWDFVGEDINGENEIWRMCVDDVDYPRLSMEFAKNGDFACPDGTGTEDLQAMAQQWLSTVEINPDNFNYASDATFDEKINFKDFLILSQNW